MTLASGDYASLESGDYASVRASLRDFFDRAHWQEPVRIDADLARSAPAPG